ncbi:neuronal PAS domain-containing protein 4-like [Notolabrus celidotus]|uniref:neuronal PAS domain-containing protein 4-like n=1 Tax=Notolabrus celidotus TaxID=1203425 RepID=UPI0014903093|nr:neuronal PAS domain-containing protein 4-like [Notolabrus celidotus]
MKSRGNALCSSHPPPGDPHSAPCRRLRSTKGASKARRDHINHEIRNMRALLPVSRDDQERLSYLHSMAAICTFIRKTVLLRGLPAAERSDRPPPYEAFLPALHGFILVTTAQGRLVYVSENVSEYLGFSMLDVLQGDSVYDMLERSDVDAVKSHLDTEHDSSSERSFVCRMQSSKAFRLQYGGGCCSILVRGRYRSFPHPLLPSSSSSSPLFVALCSPTVDRLQSSDSPSCLSFHSMHGLDMSFTQTSHSVEHVWGYSADELIGRSWYGLIHPEDLSACAAAHTSLLQADEGSRVEMVLRLQCKDLSWTWIYTQANKLCELQGVSCTNFTISETEARFLQTTISGEAFKPSASCHLHAQQPPPQTQSAKCVKRRRTSDSQSEDQSGRARDVYFMASGCSRGDTSPVPLGDSLALFTPPYSPASSSSSSGSPLQHEELSHDLLMDVHGYTMLSSPETCFPEAVLTCHLSPSIPPPAAEQPLEPTAFIRLPARSPLSSSSAAFEFPASDVRLVPGSLSLSDLCESSADCALHQDDLSLLQQPPGGVLLHTQHVPHHVLPLHANLLTPNQSPPSTESDYSEREQEEISILAQQISSLASSFNSYHSLSPRQNVIQPAPSNTSTCDWPPLPLKREQVLEDSVFESLLKDLDMVTSVKSNVSHSGFVSHSYQPGLCSRSRIGSLQLQEEELLGVPLALQEELLPAETYVDPFSVQLGRHEQNSELHQLNQYMQRVLQQDALSEENLY